MEGGRGRWREGEGDGGRENERERECGLVHRSMEAFVALTVNVIMPSPARST